jgi:DNA-binding CsgD family transcriptional regulator/tetratricopeptide (TPR) repeat protein
MVLLERETQLGLLEDALAKTARGRGRTIAISGEAGAGKTTLVQAFADQAGERAWILRSACEDLSIPDPLGPLHELGRHAGWTLPERDDDGQSLLSLFYSALDVFTTGPLPSLLVIEDLHWADNATLDFVRFLGRRLHEQRVLLLLTTRNDESEGQRRLRRALADIPVDDILRIDVPLLTQDAVAMLSAEAGLDGRAVYRATAGNAFFVTELLRSDGRYDPPPNVLDAVLARAERLSGGARAVLSAASIFPRRVETAVLEALCGERDPRFLTECLSTGMLIDLGDGYAFRHEIARHAIEVALPASTKRALNASALAILRADSDTPLARLVGHALEAQNITAVRELAPITARQAALVGAHREALQHYQTALDYAEDLAATDRADLLERYAYEAYLVGNIKPAITTGLSALQLHRSLGNRLREGDCLRLLSRISYFAGDRKSADVYGREAMAILEAMPPGPELAMAYSNQSQLDMLEAKVDSVLRYGEKAIALAEIEGRLDIVCHALNNIGTAEAWIDAESARRHLEQSLEMAVRLDLEEHAARAYLNRGWVEVNLLCFQAAESVLLSGIDYCVARDIDPSRDYMRGWLAELRLRQGCWDEARQIADQVLDNVNTTSFSRQPALAVRMKLALRRGEAGVEDSLREAWQFLERGMEPQRLAPLAMIKAERAWLGLDETDEALRLLNHCIEGTTTRAVFGEMTYWKRALAPGADLGALRGLAKPYRLLFSGDWQGAADAWAEIGAPYDRALALLEGDEPAQREAIAIFDSLGAKAVAQRVRAIMRRKGVRHVARGPRQTTRENQAGLTTREMDVLRLIGRGLSNKSIARQLSISPKTVDHHVTAILAKLEATSRGEAMVIARDHGLI